MARTVFFSFHYQRDILRVQQVKQHYVAIGNYTEAGYFDGSLEEKAKRDGDPAVKKLIDQGLKGSSVLCVLIGKETYNRRWVDYEILKSISLGKGVFGIRIHQLKDPNKGTDTAGSNPFSFLGYGTATDGKYKPMIRYDSGWKDAPYQDTFDKTGVTLLANTDKRTLGDLLAAYDWVDGDGYNNFGNWVEKAAKQAGIQ